MRTSRPVELSVGKARGKDRISAFMHLSVCFPHDILCVHRDEKGSQLIDRLRIS